MKVKTAYKIFMTSIFLGFAWNVSQLFHPGDTFLYLTLVPVIASFLLSFYVMFVYWRCPQCKSYLGRVFHYRCKKCGLEIKADDLLKKSR